jgi:hypothetical protein
MGIDQYLGDKKPKSPEPFSITGISFIQEKEKCLKEGGGLGVEVAYKMPPYGVGSGFIPDRPWAGINGQSSLII